MVLLKTAPVNALWHYQCVAAYLRIPAERDAAGQVTDTIPR